VTILVDPDDAGRRYSRDLAKRLRARKASGRAAELILRELR
jgi:hypothetical protein